MPQDISRCFYHQPKAMSPGDAIQELVKASSTLRTKPTDITWGGGGGGDYKAQFFFWVDQN
jgi:hypothetical protein